MNKEPHIPVMLSESLSLFRGVSLKTFFDGTVGSGAFADALLKEHPEVEEYVACDRDTDALALAEERLEAHGEVVRYRHANFCDIVAEHEGYNGFFLTLGFPPCSWTKENADSAFRRRVPSICEWISKAP
ncbi:MAG: 16S rRNA (cytosine(1402)-N(4))-methyltransferase [Chlamydiota bacterium]|nr:16S rRNA (cytosine(1402)-N(4))-methyltransferase [Chlamydiota bacterium]